MRQMGYYTIGREVENEFVTIDNFFHGSIIFLFDTTTSTIRHNETILSNGNWNF